MSVKLAVALMTLGSFVEIATLADAVEEVRLPLSVVVAELPAPTSPFTVTVTGVPTGIFVPVRLTVTGLVVPAGSVMSGAVKEPSGVAGALTPATEVMRSVGVFASATAVG
ncbi:MAG: hypothetical protein DMD91_20640 [Candidatus Rokuibacteriota bacterium]|nr:MAG: hypothetical protein DMD91_20640 [Candidatus Rokubacteria bacterium]